MKSFEHDAVCPHCKYIIEMASSTVRKEAPRGPVPGDITICINCAEFSVFGDDMHLEVPTPAVLAEIMSNPEAVEVHQALLKVLLKTRPKQ